MTTPTPNIPLLRKAVEFVEASAELHGADPIDAKHDQEGLGAVWYQGDWADLINDGLARAELAAGQQVDLETCGTAYCVAGYVSSLQPGYKAKIKLDSYDEPFLEETINGEGFSHSDVAQKALGLTELQADALFSGGNTAADVRTFAERIAGEKL